MPSHHHAPNQNSSTTMTASHQTQGVQQLLIAEKRAAEKVAEARKRKIKRIKQAREEAAAEIEAYRWHREEQFVDFETKYMGCSEDMAIQIERNTEVLLKEMEENVKKYKNAVIEDLIYLVIKIEPEVHRNYYIMQHFKKI